MTGVEVASAGKNEGLGGQQQGWRAESPAWEEGHKEGGLVLSLQHWGWAIGDSSLGEKKT